MTSYRLYSLDGTGHIRTAEWLEAATDSEAIGEAHRMKCGATRCEVWQGGRLVEVLEPSTDKEAIISAERVLSKAALASGNNRTIEQAV